MNQPSHRPENAMFTKEDIEKIRILTAIMAIVSGIALVFPYAATTVNLW